MPGSRTDQSVYISSRPVVLGASGFIGRWLAYELSSLGAFPVLVVRNVGEMKKLMADYGIRGEVVAFDYFGERGLDDLMLRLKPTICFNAIGYGVRKNELDPKRMRALNSELPLALCRAVARARDPKWAGVDLLHLGSSMEYGQTREILDGDAPTAPHTNYGITKLAGTQAVLAAAKENSLKAKVLRPFTVFGPGESPGRLLPTLREAVPGSDPIPLSAGDQKRSFLYVRDLARAALAMGLFPDGPPIVNAGSKKLLSVREFAELAADSLGIPRSRLSFGALSGNTAELGMEKFENRGPEISLTPLPEALAETARFGEKFDLSLVIPCRNEEASIRRTATDLLAEFRRSGIKLELILVDNGSTDSTGQIISALAAEYAGVQARNLTENLGYGRGILHGLTGARGEYLGFTTADGQIDAASVRRIASGARENGAFVLTKARRLGRREGLTRRLFTFGYRALGRTLFPDLPGRDINGNPKVFHRSVWPLLNPRSTKWFLDSELVIRAHELGLGVQEVSVASHPRLKGESNVRWATAAELFRDLIRFRLRAGTRVSATCRACDSTIRDFAEFGRLPIVNALREFLPASEERHPIVLGFCSGCGYLQLLQVIEGRRLFGHYTYQTGVSAQMRAHFHSLASELKEKLKLERDDLVVEVGSNDGTFLQGMRSAAESSPRVLGVEPAENLAAAANAQGIPTVTRFFGPETAEAIRQSHGLARVIVANNVVAHVNEPLELFRAAHSLLQEGGLLSIEVPYLKPLVENLLYDTIYHEHISYFSIRALTQLATRAGFHVKSVEHLSTHGGSLRFQAERTAASPSISPEVQSALRAEAGESWLKNFSVPKFVAAAKKLQKRQVAFLRKLRAEGNKIASYGASAKGNSCFNYCGIGPDLIDFVVDRSELKVGKFVPGVGLPIKPLSYFRSAPPNYLVVASWNLRREITEQEHEFTEDGGKCVTLFPEPRVIS